MKGVAEARAFGAATIVNAIALGRGAAFGIDLWTTAKVTITKSKEIQVIIRNDPAENTLLAVNTVRHIFKHFDVRAGAEVAVDSNIPIARGLKSSSVAANAIGLATVKALGKKASGMDVVSMGVDAAIESKVTLTGAFDDACASFFGGAVVTDNFTRRLIRRFGINEDPQVLLFIPREKRYTIHTDLEQMRRIAPLVEIAWETALHGDYWKALTLNGYIYSTEMNLDRSVALTALNAGAIAAGLSGKGPTTVAVVAPERAGEVKRTWSRYRGEIKEAQINRKRAHVVR